MKKIPSELIEWWAGGNGAHKIFPNHLESLLEDECSGNKKRFKRFVVIGLNIPFFLYVQYLSAGSSFNGWLGVSVCMSLLLFLMISLMIKEATSLPMYQGLILRSFLHDLQELYRIGRIDKHLIGIVTHKDPVLSKDPCLTDSEASRCAAYMWVSMHELTIKISMCGDSNHPIHMRMRDDLILGFKLMKKFQLVEEDTLLTDFGKSTGPHGIWSDSTPPTRDSS